MLVEGKKVSVGETDYEKIDDLPLVARVRVGESDALEEFDKRLRKSIRAYLKRLQRPNLASDWKQDVELEVRARVWKILVSDGIPLRVGLVPLAAAVCKRVVSEETRKGKEKVPISEDESTHFGEFVPISHEDTFRKVQLSELSRLIETELSTCLNENEIEVLKLYFWQGHTQRQIARLLGIPLETVKSRFYRAQRKLALSETFRRL